MLTVAFAIVTRRAGWVKFHDRVAAAIGLPPTDFLDQFSIRISAGTLSAQSKLIARMNVAAADVAAIACNPRRADR